ATTWNIAIAARSTCRGWTTIRANACACGFPSPRWIDPDFRSSIPPPLSGGDFFQTPILAGQALTWRRFLLHGSEILAMIAADHQEHRMSSAVYTATVLTSARAAAGMTSRARRPMTRHPAG